MIEFKRRRLPVWVCVCDDITDYNIIPPILDFNDMEYLRNWLKITLDVDDSDLDIDERRVLSLGGVCGWINIVE